VPTNNTTKPERVPDFHQDPALESSWIVEGENLAVAARLPDGVADLVYLDPPFNTGKRQERRTLVVERDEAGDRRGFGDHRYKTVETARASYADRFDNYLDFLELRLVEARRLLTATGSLFLHLDSREAHYAKVLLDELFGRDSFQNEIVWAYDFGARSRRRWSSKHDTILWYTVHPRDYTFDFEAMDRIPYMAPGLVGPEKAARGKTPTDVWWHTIVSPTGKEKTGYPTQKPLGVLERIVKVHSRPGDLVLDLFAGSGTAGDAAARNQRRFFLVDENPEAIEVMRRRLCSFAPRSTRIKATAQVPRGSS